MVSEKAGKILVAEAALEPSQIQDLADTIPALLEIKAKHKVPFTFTVKIEMGDGKNLPTPESVKEANNQLKKVKEDLKLSQKYPQ